MDEWKAAYSRFLDGSRRDAVDDGNRGYAAAETSGPAGASGISETGSAARGEACTPAAGSKAACAGLDSTMTFDTFVPCTANRFARTAALALAEGPCGMFSPLCVYGSSGLGKTHLLQAAGNQMLSRNPDTRVRYVTGRRLAAEVADRGETAALQQYDSCDLLLVDGLQDMCGHEEAQHMLMGLMCSSPVIISSDTMPGRLTGLDPRLRSRLDAGLTVVVGMPDYGSRLAIARMMAHNAGYRLTDDVLDVIARHCHRSVREMKTGLACIIEYARINGGTIDERAAESFMTQPRFAMMQMGGAA
ncbi:DnaA/Hda family protein [Bifidobacterium leontopitheci]|uniref:DnaA/Hda family protein n=1 Tax=Bifidobacterium leontopitheci TaxID=2650774 RepID=UPI00186B4841|nr:DnaA/Hda family protein [Bifidobacterium leontopitheci]